MKLTKRKDGRWHKAVTLPDGAKKYFYSSEATERKAERDIEAQILNYTGKQHLQNHNFLELAERMLEAKEGKVSYSAHKGYEYSIKRLECFHDMDIENISAMDIQKLYEHMNARCYSKDTIRKTKSALIQTFKFAVLAGCDVRLDMLDAVPIPRRAAKTKVTAVNDEITNFIIKNAVPGDFTMWAFILLCTGMRRGELLALKKSAINFNTGEIKISEAVEFINNKPNVKSPKTSNSIRTIPIIDILHEPLKKHCASLAPDDFIFGKTKPLSLTVIRRKWKNYCTFLGIDIHQHQLRHSYAKSLYRSGVDAKTAQSLLGHANISITMDIYTDFSKDVTEKSAEKLNSFFLACGS